MDAEEELIFSNAILRGLKLLFFWECHGRHDNMNAGEESIFFLMLLQETKIVLLGPYGGNSHGYANS
jgi:hypothetical protein